MPKFSKLSEQRLNELHPELQRLLREAIKYVDFSIDCGHRSKMEQDKAVASGKSQTPWPTSKHNSVPSLAVDISPYPTNWKDERAFDILAGILLGLSFSMGIQIRLGADWDGDLNTLEHSFVDRPHLELIL